MSYTPPAGNALIFDFSTVSGYTPPAGDALIFAFGDEFGSAPYARAKADSPFGSVLVVAAGAVVGSVASPTMIGLPRAAAMAPVVAHASAAGALGGATVVAGVQVNTLASSSSPIGAPKSVANVAIVAVSSTPGMIGAGAARGAVGIRAMAADSSVIQSPLSMAENPVVHVDGVSAARYGSISATVGVTPNSVAVIRYGYVIAAYDVAVAVDPTEPSSRGGVPVAWNLVTQIVGTVNTAYGSCTTMYGHPSAGHPQLADVPGALLTGYGSPSVAVRASPSGAYGLMHGHPSAVAAITVAGARGTMYGHPANIIGHIVAGARNTKYGKVTAIRPRSHMVYSLNNGRRAGVPRAAEIA